LSEVEWIKTILPHENDLGNRLTKLTNNIDDTNTITFEYANYDDVGNRLSCKIDDANAHDYDVLYQLITTDYNDGNVVDYYYGKLGNRTHQKLQPKDAISVICAIFTTC